MRAALSLILAWGTAAAGLAAGPDRESSSRALSCRGIVVSSNPSSARAFGKPTFSSREVLDVTFEVVFARRPGTRVPDSFEFRLYTPNGFLYRRNTVPVGEQGSPERERSLLGRRHPLETARWRPRVVGRGQAVAVAAPPLLVAGTDIMLNSLYGRWRAEAWAPAEPRACGAAFEILP
jgi:hypothetical protein